MPPNDAHKSIVKALPRNPASIPMQYSSGAKQAMITEDDEEVQTFLANL